jgi:hypothetical protein
MTNQAMGPTELMKRDDDKSSNGETTECLTPELIPKNRPCDMDDAESTECSMPELIQGRKYGEAE